MSTPRPALSTFVEVDTSRARTDRIWAAVQRRIDSAPAAQRRQAPRALLLAAALLAAFGAGLLLSWQAPPSGWAELQTAAGLTSVRLKDGSALTLDPHTSLSVRGQSERRVELALESGRVECDVTHVPERAFSVVAAGHEVLVRGTRFWVELSRERSELRVEVQSGRVEVRRTGAEQAVALLSAGQHWSVALDSQATGKEASVSSGNTGGLPVAAPRPAASPPAGPMSAPAPSPNSPAAAASRERSAAQRTDKLRSSVAEQGARALLERANAARRRGDLAAAAQAYEQLLREHAGDARAGLAAFELGRLRMDEFHDVHGAIEVLQLAARTAREDASREDALARLVRAHQILRERERCRSARAEYLQAYPTGTHVLAVLKACDDW